MGFVALDVWFGEDTKDLVGREAYSVFDGFLGFGCFED